MQENHLILRAQLFICICFSEEIIRVLYEYVDDVRTIGLGFDSTSFQKLVGTVAKINKGKYPVVKVVIGELATTEEALPRWHHAHRMRTICRCDGDDRDLGNFLKIPRREDCVESHN